MDETDRDERLEWRLWRINLMIFFLALAAVIGMVLWAPSSWLVPLNIFLWVPTNTPD